MSNATKGDEGLMSCAESAYNFDAPEAFDAGAIMETILALKVRSTLSNDDL